MNNRYSVGGMVVLPRMQATGALALGKRLLAVADAEPAGTGAGITKAREALRERVGEVQATLVDRADASPATPDEVRACDRRLDACWSGLRDMLTGLSKLPDAPEATEAALLMQAIYDKGLSFIQIPFALEWAESQVRMERLSAQGLRPRIDALGCGRFLTALDEAHAAYGKALGMTEPVTAASTETPKVRAALDAFATTLRFYVTKVLGSVDLDDAPSAELADRLLAPLNAWDVGPAGAGKPEVLAVPAPTPDPATV